MKLCINKIKIKKLFAARFSNSSAVLFQLGFPRKRLAAWEIKFSEANFPGSFFDGLNAATGFCHGSALII